MSDCIRAVIMTDKRVPGSLDIAQELRALRRYRGMTQAAVGAAMVPPISHAAVSDVERGKTSIDFALLHRLCDVLDCRVSVSITSKAVDLG